MLRLCLCFLVAAALLAAQPLSTISTSQPFEINGARVLVAGIPSHPLVAGDTVTMGAAPGLVRFADGSQLFVLPNSRLELSTSANAPSVKLASGGVAYRFAGDSPLQLSALSTRVSASSDGSGQGRLWFEDANAWWYPSGANYMLVATLVRPAAGQPTFTSERVTPKNLSDVAGWRDYEPDWAQLPGGSGSGLIPPGAATDPTDPAAISSRNP